MSFGTSGTMFTSAPWIEGLVGAVATFNYGLSLQHISEDMRADLVADFNRLLIEKSMSDPEWQRALIAAADLQDGWHRRFKAPEEIG